MTQPGLVIAPDIFGVTPELQRLVERLESTACVVDPHAGCRDVPRFERESDAYAFFMEHVGLKRYVALVREAIADLDGRVRVVGFSVGASAAWCLSGEPRSTEGIADVVAFYGSQIRRHIDVDPRVSTRLIFPDDEASFSVDDLADSLSSKANVTVERAAAGHGFMNRRSSQFDPRAYEHYVGVLRGRPVEP